MAWICFLTSAASSETGSARTAPTAAPVAPIATLSKRVVGSKANNETAAPAAIMIVLKFIMSYLLIGFDTSMISIGLF
jgi:hypothetical protein